VTHLVFRSPGTPQCAPKFNTTSLFAPITADEPYPDSPSFYASLPESTRIHLIGLLDNWSFEPYLLPAELLVPCALLLFESLFCMEGMDDVIGLKLNEGSSSRDGVNFARDIVPFVYQLRGIYRTEPRYHNYEHALDVLQGCYMILKTAGMVPSVRVLLEESPARWEPTRPYDASEGPLVDCLDVQDIFAIYITAIGHDVGHPGFTNAFMVCCHVQPDRRSLTVILLRPSAIDKLPADVNLSIFVLRAYASFVVDANNATAGWLSKST